MKKLKLTLLVGESGKSDMINTFGSVFKEIKTRNNTYMQFTFPIRILNSIKLEPVSRLISTYERDHGTIKSKIFHLFDYDTKRSSPTYIQCLNDKWLLVETNTQREIKIGNHISDIV